jgi:hypothetical protein
MCLPGATLDILGELSDPKISSTNILSPKEKSCASTNVCQKKTEISKPSCKTTWKSPEP